jgi:uncharacterized protein YbjQ (UPF0145 family)
MEAAKKVAIKGDGGRPGRREGVRHVDFMALPVFGKPFARFGRAVNSLFGVKRMRLDARLYPYASKPTNPVGGHMLFLLGNEKKAKKPTEPENDSLIRVKELFFSGRFPVVTTEMIEGKQVEKVLGLVACRGYDSEEAFFGMTSRAISKGATGIVGYQENVAFHPDGSKYFSCYGTAVQFEEVRRAAPRPTPPSNRPVSRHA